MTVLGTQERRGTTTAAQREGEVFLLPGFLGRD